MVNLADLLMLPLVVLFFGALLMPGWRSLGIWFAIGVAVLVAALLAVRFDPDKHILGAGVIGIYVVFGAGALLGGTLLRVLMLLIWRPRPKQ